MFNQIQTWLFNENQFGEIWFHFHILLTLFRNKHSSVVGLTLMGCYGRWEVLTRVLRTSLTSYKIVRVVALEWSPGKGSDLGYWTDFKECYLPVHSVLTRVPWSCLGSAKAKDFFQNSRPGYGAHGWGCSLGLLDRLKGL